MTRLRLSLVGTVACALLAALTCSASALGAEPPAIESQSAGSIEREAATLEATINPRGSATEYSFEYIDDTDFRKGGFTNPATEKTAPAPLGDGMTGVAVEHQLQGLEIGTIYHYRAVAVSAAGTAVGPPQLFSTVPVATIGNQWAYAHFASATVEAAIDPTGLSSSCRVEYVEAATYEASHFAEASSQPCVALVGPALKGATAKAELPLAPDHVYYFRFVASNASGSVSGRATKFETFGIKSFSVRSVDEEGNLVTQAGAHPYEAITRYVFKSNLVPSEEGVEISLDGFVKDLLTELPPGRSSGSNDAAPRCPARVAEEQRCSGSSQVGTVAIYYGLGNTETRPLYSVVPPPGTEIRYATTDPYLPTDAHVRSATDFGLNAESFNSTEKARVYGVTAVTWGVPADPRHDRERVCGAGESPCTSHAPLLPIVRNPTSCAGPLSASARVDTWESPGEFVSADTQIPATTGCDLLSFNPALIWQSTSRVADSPAGLDIDIHTPQNQDPYGLGDPDLRDVSIIPAEGMLLNPSGANGLVGCSSAQFGQHSEDPDNCPDASKVGSVEIDSPLLENPVHGGIYIATPHDNPFDSTFAIYLAVHDAETGLVVKLAGDVEPNPSNGNITATFSDQPQIPFEDFRLHFFDGPRSVLRTPPTCGDHTTEAFLTPWSAPASGPPAQRADTYRITAMPNGRGCISKPEEGQSGVSMRAGTDQPDAGAYSPFEFNLNREDGTQQIANLLISPPAGQLGKLRGISQCSDAAIAAAEASQGREELAHPACPASSRLGTVTAAAGAGSAPYYVHGGVYLAGPHRGAPLSLAVIVPIVAGPYDLGVIVDRTGLNVALESGRLDVHADPIPTIIDGVSLDLRSVAVRLDRPGFTLNPTNCNGGATQARVNGAFGAAQELSAPLKVTGCRRLGFAPRVGMRLFGKVHRGAHPRLRVQINMPEGGANMAAVSVALPRTEFLDSTHIRGICTRPQFTADECPADSIYGHITAWTPLLEKPLSGPVFMRSSHHRWPDLVSDLEGQFRLALGGRIGTGHGGVATHVENIPDAPVSKVVLTMKGGPRGLLQNSLNLCRQPRHAVIRFEGQNGKTKLRRPLLRAQCSG